MGETRPEGIKLESSINHKSTMEGSELCRKGGKLQTFNRSQPDTGRKHECDLKAGASSRLEPTSRREAAGIGSSAPLKGKDGWMDILLKSALLL